MRRRSLGNGRAATDKRRLADAPRGLPRPTLPSPSEGLATGKRKPYPYDYVRAGVPINLAPGERWIPLEDTL